MSQHDDVVRLGHMLDSARKILAWTRGKQRSDFDQDRLLRSGIAYEMQIIGEAASKVSKSFREKHSTLPWKQMIGARHIIVHGYMEVDDDLLWNTVEGHIPKLVRQLEQVLDEHNGT